MTTRLLLLFIAASLLAAAAGFALLHWQPANSLGYFARQWGLVGGQLGGLLLLVHTGTILPSTYFNLLAGCLALALVGALFIVLHWPAGRLLLLAGLLGVLLTYTTRFYFKRPKSRLDLIKWLWVLAATVGAVGIVQHWLPREAAYVAQALFWLAVLEVAVTYGRAASATASN